jgi:glycosyltransferase involved in cell wall biosynthesis
MASQNKALLSIIIPVYNEEKTVEQLLARVAELQLTEGFEKQIIVVNDASRDGSLAGIERFIKACSQEITFLNHRENRGKGAAIRTALSAAKGDYIIIQDADLELEPRDINLLLSEAVNNQKDVVYGSRFLKKSSTQKITLSYLANQFLTWLTGALVGKKITDMETCYKLIKSEWIKSVDLKEDRFGFEPEITMRLLRQKNIRYGEVPITYVPRTADEGKKIGWKDGVRAVYCLIRYRFSK